VLKRQVGSTNRVRGKPELAFHAAFALLNGGGSSPDGTHQCSQASSPSVFSLGRDGRQV